jgi:hypothetical protein
VVASDGFAAVERRTEGIASGSEKRRTPRDHARELALPKNMFNSLSPLATGAAPLGKYRSKRVWSSVSDVGLYSTVRNLQVWERRGLRC